MTVKQTTQRLGPSMRMAVDLADLGKVYYEGRSFPTQFRRVEAKDTLVLEAR